MSLKSIDCLYPNQVLSKKHETSSDLQLPWSSIIPC